MMQKKVSFIFDGRQGHIIFPKEPRADGAWIFTPAFFNIFPIAEKAFLEKGFHLVSCNFAHEYANFDAVGIANILQKELVEKYKLNPKATLEGLSRGGAFSINYANKNPDSIACLYLDAPVCDFASWPSRNAKALWEGLCQKWKVKDVEDMANFEGNPINNTDNLPKIPIIVVAGDSDTTVPHKDNIEVLLGRYKAKGGTNFKLILEEGKGHHPHGLKDPSPVVEFVENVYDSLK